MVKFVLNKCDMVDKIVFTIIHVDTIQPIQRMRYWHAESFKCKFSGQKCNLTNMNPMTNKKRNLHTCVCVFVNAQRKHMGFTPNGD